MASRLREGWYLMSTRDLEIELALEREARARSDRSSALPISMEEALAFRNAGNVPDEFDRTLRLVLRISRPGDIDELRSKRLIYEPDYLEAPSWRAPDSIPVNVVPLRTPDSRPSPEPGPWWDEPDLARLEAEWENTGTVAGVAIPATYRGFVYKTVLELQAAGRPVTVAAIADSIARWTPCAEAQEIRGALEEANQESRPGDRQMCPEEAGG
jgi:hypothetical protein